MIPEFAQLVLSTPLYAKINLGKELESYLTRLRLSDKKIDGYCPRCKKDTTYTHLPDTDLIRNAVFVNFPAKVGYEGGQGPGLTDFHFREKFMCSRNSHHKLEVYFRVNQLTIEKVGQSPSIADLQFGKYKKYEGVLGEEYHAELTKAIGLKAHGVGIGSFVYLRRIFEKLIEEAHQLAKADSGWDEKEYLKSRMPEKVGLLKSLLPSTLVENKSIYGVMSLAIHELEENQALEVHDLILDSIEIILDEKQHDQLKEKRQQDLKKKMSSFNFGAGEKASTAPGKNG